MKTRFLWLALGLAGAVLSLGRAPDRCGRDRGALQSGSLLPGADGRSEVRMLIRDGQGREQLRQFTILRMDLADGGDQHFYVAFSRPADVRDTVFMVAKHVDRDDDRWLYLPGLDLVKRILRR